MTDWKGNEIQVGQTVLLIATGNMFEGSTFSLMMCIGNELKEVYKGDPIPKSYSFDIVEKYLITEPSNIIIHNFRSDINEMPINHADFFICKQPYHIIAIEGVSDNEQEYYENYFRA